jgi:hypothetical protein
VAKLECNICHEHGVSGKSRRILLTRDYTRAPWWTMNVLAYVPAWFHVVLFLAALVLGGALAYLLPLLARYSGLDFFVSLEVTSASFLLMLGAGELLSRFWQRRLGLRRAMFHRYQCHSCSSQWEWVEVSPLRPQLAQAGTTELQSSASVSPDGTTPLDA